MKRKISTLIILLVVSAFCQAHEFWLQSNKFIYHVGEEMKVNFNVGENFDGEPWDFKKHGIERMTLYQVFKSTDLKAMVKTEAKDKLSVKLAEEGNYMLAMQSKNDYIELDAEKFNSYLKEDGIDNVYEERVNTRTMDKPSKEFYMRFVKLLVQVGSQRDDTYKKSAGLRIEIMPDQNPYQLKPGDHLQCTILFDGKPVPHQLVKVWNKINLTTFVQNIYTENDGTLTFPISTKGVWMVSTVKMIAAEQAGADWQSLWGSLVFGI